MTDDTARIAALELQVAALRAELTVQAEFLDAHADRLDGWAEDSKAGGWSTHQVAANRAAAGQCRKMMAGARAALSLPAPSPSKVAALVEAAMKLRERDIDKLGEGFHRALLELHDATDALTGKEPGDG